MKKHIFSLLVWLLLNSCSGGKGNKDLKIYASGIVEAREVIVSSEVSGRIVELNFDEGSRVDSGFVLCRVDTEMIYQRYLEAKSQAEALLSQYQLLLKGARREEIEAMEQAVERAKVNFENAKKHFERIKKLYEENVMTQEQFDNAKMLYESSKSQYEEAVKKLEILKSGAREEEIKIAFANYQRALAQMKSVELQIKKSKILSPISGFVTTKFVELGEFVSPGVPIAKISNLDVPLRGSLFLLFVSTFIFLMATLGLGIFSSVVSRTQQQALMTAYFFAMPNIILSGFVFPVESMPSLIRFITNFIPLKYFLLILRGVFLKGAGFELLYPNIIVLLCLGVFNLRF
jgi:multidrug efflux pump subunit AcrA (membrane-fusion protein)